jgi:hypothetical protein
MNCADCQALMLDALTETASSDCLREREAHLASCADCRRWSAEVGALWAELGALPRLETPATPAPGVVVALHTQARRRWVRLSLAYAAGLLLVFWAGRSLAPTDRLGPLLPAVPAAAPTTGSLPTWLLLLREPTGAPIVAPGTSAAEEVVREYGMWAGSLAQTGQLVSAEKLAGPATHWLPEALPSEATTISGFFLIRAADSADATRIALESPHVRRGGTIELRRIDPT